MLIFNRAQTVQPLFFKQEHLSMERMMKLMAVDDAGKSALYMEVSPGSPD